MHPCTCFSLSFPCWMVHGWLTDAFCGYLWSSVSTQSKAAIHLVAVACCDPNWGSPAPEIAASPWERSAMADCLMSVISAAEVSGSVCQFAHRLLIFGLSGILHHLPLALPHSTLCSPCTPCSSVKSCTWVKFSQTGHKAGSSWASSALRMCLRGFSIPHRSTPHFKKPL